MDRVADRKLHLLRERPVLTARRPMGQANGLATRSPPNPTDP
jgi:hypothetical protein